MTTEQRSPEVRWEGGSLRLAPALYK